MSSLSQIQYRVSSYMAHLPFEVTGKECFEQVRFLDGMACVNVGERPCELDRLVAGSNRKAVSFIGSLQECGTFVVERTVFSHLGTAHLGVGGDALAGLSKPMKLALTRQHHGGAQGGRADRSAHEVAIGEFNSSYVLLHVDAVENGS